MNSTLNNLALLSFNRKARKISKDIGVINCMDVFFIPYCVIRAGETLFIWSEENGFHSVLTENDKELAYLVDFPEKYGYDEVYHFGILNADKTTLSIFRCYDQLTHKKEVLPYGLQFHTDEYRKERDFELQQESELPFMQQGQGSRL
ncbi:MAG: hypothetical protein NT068_01815 [Candidatus Nomurabacteria bacterium]|nr:hypothetical protein [Candidatus Nomurabacteria bacterium]